MVDNVILNSGSGGATLATDDIAGVQHQRVKIQYGIDGAATDVSDTNPLPIDDAGGSLTVDGTVTANAGTGTFTTTHAAIGAEASALGSGVLVQGDDGTDRKNINVDAATGDVQVDVTNVVNVSDNGGSLTVDGSVSDQHTAKDLDYDTGAGVDTVSAYGIALPAAGGAVAGGTSTNPLRTDPTGTTAQPITDNGGSLTVDSVDLSTVAGAVAGTEMQVDVVAPLPAGTNAIGKLAANSGVDIGDVDVTSIAAGSNLIGDVGVGVRTSGGTSIFRSLDLDETEEEVKATAGQIYWIHAMNLSAGLRYLKIYNATAATVVVGTTTPVLTFALPTQGDTNGAGFTLSIPNGIALSTAITVAATTGIADADVGAPGVNEVVLNLGYS